MGVFLGRGGRQVLTGALAAVVMAGVAAVPASAAPAPDTTDAVQASPVALTQAQALAKARATGKAVQVDGATTSTSTVMANPDGSLTLSAAAVPVRKRVGKDWVSLDPTLHVASDGGVVPAATTSAVVLSGGGSGPLATLGSPGRVLALSASMSLPKPTLSGATATYANVLPDVDLVATVDAQGGFSEVFVVRTPAAAAALAAVKLGTRTEGVSLRADNDGNLSAVDGHGQAVFTAAAPMMWDSSVAPGVSPRTDARTGVKVDGATHRPVASSYRGPGAGARTASLGVAVGAADITLTPGRAMPAASALTYPLYYDPTWTPANVSKSAWATVAKQFGGTSYYNKTPDPQGHMQVGNSGSGGIWSHTLINFGIPPVLAGATIKTASLTMTEVWSYSCTASEIDVYAPSATLSSGNATWNAWSSVDLGTKVNGVSAAHGYNSGCPAASIGFDVLPAVSSAVAASKSVQTFVFTAANEAGDTNGYKEFDAGTPQLSITYNHPPNTPGEGLTTSPSTDCTATPPTAVGDGEVSLYAPVSDPNGGTLGVKFQLWKTSAPATILASSDPNVLTYTSGTTAVLVVPESTLKTAAGTVATQFSWHVQTTDTIATSAWSKTCSFVFDPTRPGAPSISAGGASTIGQPTTVTITAGPGTAPASYTYQLNGQAPKTVAATSGNTTITVTPGRFTNTLAVAAASSGGNFGDTATLTFNAAAAAVQADHDLDGDGNADLTTVGAGGSGLPAGLWLARGTTGPAMKTTASDIGINGSTYGGSGPVTYTGAQVITGHFTGSGLQDVLVYYPSGANAGNGVIIHGNGDGSTLQPAYDATELYAGTIMDTLYGYPTQLVNVGNAAGYNLAYPDLLGVSSDGTSLNYFPNTNSTGGYYMTVGLTTLTPTGGTDWSSWTLATSQTASGATSMFLRNKTTGGLYLWTNVTADLNAGTLNYTAHTIAASGWNTGATLTLQAEDVNQDGVADLRTVGAATVTTYLTGNVTATGATLTAQTPQALTTANHQWVLDNLTASNAADCVGTLTAAATSGATQNTGDLFSPDVKLDGNGGLLSTASPAVATNSDFTVSAWVKPSTVGGVVLSQDGSQTSGFKLWADSASKSWRFGLATSDTANATYDIASGAAGSVGTGVWTELTATYRQTGGVLNLYVNGVNVGTATHTGNWNATGKFRIGASATQGAAGEFLTGQVANVQTWNQVVDPTQAYTPGSYYQTMTPTRFLDTRTGVGAGGATAPIGPTSTLKLAIAGMNGIPATGVTAVAINTTVVSPTTGGFLTLFPTNTPRPVTSNLNFEANDIVANYAIVPVGYDGSISIYNAAGGTAHVIVDVSGYFTSDAAKAGNSSYRPLSPTRILDTRSGLGWSAGPLSNLSTIAVQVGGVSGIPTGITAVAINITSDNANSAGFLVTSADGTAVPATSNLQLAAGRVRADLAIVAVGSNGKIDITMGGGLTGGHTDVIGDVVGYFTAGTSGNKYHAVNATRVLDSRQDNSPVVPFGVRSIAQGNNVIANDATLVLNIVATQETDAGYAVAYANGTTRPAAGSSVNWVANQTVAALTLPMTGGGTTDVYNASSGSTHLVVDCLGYFASN